MCSNLNNEMDFLPLVMRGIEESNGQWTYGALTQKQIRYLQTPFLAASLQLYNDFAMFKVLPHGKGTMDERRSVLDIISILKAEESAFNAWELERSKKR